MNETAPLSIDLNMEGVKTAVPMIADGSLVKLKLANLTQTSNDKGTTLKWEFDLVDPAPNTDGGQILPGALGSKVFETIPLYAKPDAKDPKWFLSKIAKRLDALLGTGDAGNSKGKPARPSLNPQTVTALIGQTMIAKISVRTGEYTGNEIKEAYFPGDVAGA